VEKNRKERAKKKKKIGRNKQKINQGSLREKKKKAGEMISIETINQAKSGKKKENALDLQSEVKQGGPPTRRAKQRGTEKKTDQSKFNVQNGVSDSEGSVKKRGGLGGQFDPINYEKEKPGLRQKALR